MLMIRRHLLALALLSGSVGFGLANAGCTDTNASGKLPPTGGADGGIAGSGGGDGAAGSGGGTGGGAAGSGGVSGRGGSGGAGGRGAAGGTSDASAD
jgi:hypothetical protein